MVYIGNGWHIGGMMVPFSGKRKRSRYVCHFISYQHHTLYYPLTLARLSVHSSAYSAEFYGRCVSQFVTITTPVKYVTDPDIMVFVTYPMTQKVHLSLEPFICLHNHTHYHSQYNTYNHTHSFLSFQYTNSFTHLLTYSLPFVLPIRVAWMTLMRLLSLLVCSRTRVLPLLSLSLIAPQVDNTAVTT